MLSVLLLLSSVVVVVNCRCCYVVVDCRCCYVVGIDSIVSVVIVVVNCLCYCVVGIDYCHCENGQDAAHQLIYHSKDANFAAQQQVHASQG